MNDFSFACVSFSSSFKDGKLSAEVFTLESDDPDFQSADVSRIVFGDGKWQQELPSEVEINKLTQHYKDWSRNSGYEIRYR